MRYFTALRAAITLLVLTTQLGGSESNLLPASGFYEAPLRISIRTNKPTVRFTTDGSVPSLTNGRPYVNPLTITHTTVLRAAVFKGESLKERVATRTYLFPREVIH